MHLLDYFHINRGVAKAIAQDLGTTVSYVWNVAYGYRQMAPRKCATIEKLTDGNVTRKDLRPHDWFLIWPELAEKEARKAAATRKKHHNREQQQESGIHA